MTGVISADAWRVSLGFHSGLVLLALGLLWVGRVERPLPPIEILELDVRESAQANAKSLLAAQPKVAPKPKVREVFGLSRNAVTAPDSDLALKAGNTVAKDADQRKLRAGDDASLPVPADEFLVTQMPKLLREVRANYPALAREKNISGVVLLELLIDAQGGVRDARVVQVPEGASGYGLDVAALEAVKQFRFEPARVENQSVAVKIRYAYRFVLEK